MILQYFSSMFYFEQVGSLTYADDGYIKTRMSVVLQVLSELKHVLNEDDDLDLNVSKTSVLPKGVTQQNVFDVTHNIIIPNPTLSHLIGHLIITFSI
jgi:hypothetical protein